MRITKGAAVFMACLFFRLIPLPLNAVSAAADAPGSRTPWIPLKVVLHAHSEASGEPISLEEMAHLARKRGVDAVILTDYLEQRVSLGLYPFHRFLKISKTQPSLATYGIAAYAAALEAARRKVDSVLLLPGAEVIPFYWWSGDLLKGNLTVYGLHKNLLVFGLAVGDLPKIPTLENGRLGMDAYHGSRGEKPYQAVIDHVQTSGGLAVWSAPDSVAGAEFQYGPIHASTLPYWHSLLATQDYTGIAIYPEGEEFTGAAGGVWDRVLSAYCRGKRRYPAWGFAEGMIHRENFAEGLARFDQVVLADQRSETAVLDAMKRGRFYIRTLGGSELELEEFRVEDSFAARSAAAGEEMELVGSPKIRVKVRVSALMQPAGIRVDIVRGGRVVYSKTSDKAALEFIWQDPDKLDPGRHYYRLIGIVGSKRANRFMSNPIFVHKTKERA